MFPHVMTVDTVAGLSLVDEEVLTPEMKHRIEPCTRATLRCASNICVQLLGQILQYLHLHDLVVQFYFGVMRYFPPKLLILLRFVTDTSERSTRVLKRLPQRMRARYRYSLSMTIQSPLFIPLSR